MGWSGSLNASSANGAEITYTSDATSLYAYTMSSFTAPKAGIYRFTCLGSGGEYHDVGSGSRSAGGTGGLTIGYLSLASGQTVYIGAGNVNCAAFVSKTSSSTIDGVGRSNMYYVAGGGGGGGANYGQPYNMKSGPGGVGGGATGGTAPRGNFSGTPGAGGGTSGGASTMKGQGGHYSNEDDTSFWGGGGGDGYYGGWNGTGSSGGGGGSGYIYTSSISSNDTTYTCYTNQGQGATSNTKGSVRVAFMAATSLPVKFNDTTIDKIIFNGTTVTSLVFNGTKIF